MEMNSGKRRCIQKCSEFGCRLYVILMMMMMMMREREREFLDAACGDSSPCCEERLRVDPSGSSEYQSA
jgi:hypothetical protein